MGRADVSDSVRRLVAELILMLGNDRLLASQFYSHGFTPPLFCNEVSLCQKTKHECLIIDDACHWLVSEAVKCFTFTVHAISTDEH